MTDTGGAVFVSYASEDAEAAQRITETLRAAGIDVWFDRDELRGGDTWDQKIRRQIRECRYFLPVISARTEARLEGYFRREWRLAVERTLDMADDHLFLLPVVIDDTAQATARVPEKFQAVQWLRVPDGQPTPALEALCRRLTGEEEPVARPVRALRGTVPRGAADAVAPPFPPFPEPLPADRRQAFRQVVHWTALSAWALWKRTPKWLRVLAIIWLALTLLSRTHQSRDADDEDTAPPPVASAPDVASAAP